MSSDSAAPGRRLLRLWARLSGLPGGAWMFSRALGRMVPYTGALGARIEDLEPGRAAVGLADRRAVRNHLGSVHAVALVNLGELATGLAVLTALPAGVRGIVIRLEAEYLKKARGSLRADAGWTPPADLVVPADAVVTAEIVDAGGDPVARVHATWKLGAAT